MKNEIRKIKHDYGIEYISERREKKRDVLLVILTLTVYYLHCLYLGCKKGHVLLNEFQIFLFIFYISFIIIYLNNHHLERLLIVSNIGIQLERNSLFQHQLKFICISDVKNIFINEAIYIFEICPYLCITLRNNKLIVLFDNFNLGMKNLVNIYRDLKRVIVPNGHEKFKSVKALHFQEEEKYGNGEEQNCPAPNYVNSTYNNSSSEEENIFKLLNFNSCENYKMNNKIRESRKIKEFDIYISKKLALDIMNS
ncbi:phosphatidylinositol N-acetylglucosaminyltransferase subunit H [Plasmodium gonderi]|uniref:Phosphatidylinositol N-acetylglucosaminyltransferase subunit H n=1 Tax=Plasmodium gonderi TaxID=77519 RepID=A0A1Y1JF88_PLAGO|nr:phosphatidylinositol N-acetylglucosaminyltransferase subunit H [Plasmodium gonderi]GAW81176.1 phosphatidylinositol N-acetylglucosaminyltransferase subunit H [Plasmodium gonderi]